MDKFVKTTFLILATGIGVISCNRQSNDKALPMRPNIVLIVSDDMGWKDLGCYGNPVHETPNIDKLAEDGVLFTNAYAAAPVCTPTRASIQTGKYPARLHITVWSENARGEHGIREGQKLVPAASIPDLPLEEKTIAEALKANGYNTAHVGKWHLGESMFYPENQGFDVNVAGGSWGMPTTFFFPYEGPFGEGERRYIPDVERSGSGGGRYFENREGEFLTDRLTDEAIRILEDGVYANAPLFLSLNFYNVHTPIEAPDSLVNYYKQKIEELGAECNPIYAAMNHIVDRNVGRILETIRKLEIDENTIVIFTSDNGGYLGPYRGMNVADNSPLRSGKGSLYEGGIRMPLIIKFPGMSKEGTVCNTPVITNDFYPTFCEFAGIDTDTLRYDGLSLVPLIQNPASYFAREDLFWHFPHYYTTTTPVSAVRHKEWKLLKYYEDNRLELYNLEKDIGERNNLSLEYADITARMVNKLDDWLKETNASFPSVNPDFSGKE